MTEKRKEVRRKEFAFMNDDGSIYSTELIDMERLNIVLGNQDHFKLIVKADATTEENDITFGGLYNYRKLYSAGKFLIKYTQNNSKGRRYARDSLSLQTMPRALRATLAHEHYIDLDMVNAHPTILYHIAKTKLKMNCKYLKEYIDKREEIIETIVKINKNETRNSIKQVILTIINGGLCNCLVNDWLNSFIVEMEQVRKEAIKRYPKRYEEVCQVRSYNTAGSLLNHLMCDLEDKILMTSIDFLFENDIVDAKIRKGITFIDAVLCFDGLMIRKTNVEDKDINKIIEDLEAHVYDEMDIPIKYKVKPLEPIQDELFSQDPKDVEIEKPSKILKSAFTDGDIADEFLRKYRTVYRYHNKVIYFFNGVYWEVVQPRHLVQKIDVMYNDLHSIISRELSGKEFVETARLILKLRSEKAQKNIVAFIIARLDEQKQGWDFNEDLLGFTNGTYDLRNETFREGRAQDFITKIIPYDFRECSTEEVKFVEDHFSEVLPEKEIRDLFYTTVASGLRGRTLQRFVIWTGNGANSKGATLKIIRTTFGNQLYVKGNNSVLTQEVRGELCVGIANMHNKRLVIYEEPSANRKIITNMMKELTGGDVLAYRGLYEGEAKTNMRGTHIMLCNKKPLLDQIDEAVHRRLIIIPFESQFRTKEHITKFIPEGTKNVFVAKDGVEDGEFLEKMKLPFLHILLRYYKSWRMNGYQITNIPNKCTELVKEYMIQSDDFTAWFNYRYEFTNNDDNFVKISDVYHEFTQSDIYRDLSCAARRTKARQKTITADIKSNPTLKMYYRDRYHRNGVDVRAALLIRYRQKSLEALEE